VSGRFPLYTDADIRGPLIRRLLHAGWDVLRAIDEYPERTKDPLHFRRAAELGRVLVTSDEHHEALAVEWYEAGRSFPGLIIWRQALNEQMGYGELLQVFEELARQDDPFSSYPIIRIWPKR
jgi:hypothetical protein